MVKEIMVKDELFRNYQFRTQRQEQAVQISSLLKHNTVMTRCKIEEEVNTKGRRRERET